MGAAALRAQLETSLGARFERVFALPQKPQAESLPTGISALDQLTGGIPRGCITEIYGAASSGRTSVLLSILAQATKKQEFCAFIDASDAFDPASAAESGVNLPQVLWVRCGGNTEHALKSADLIVQAGGFGLVVMDLADVAAAQARRISLASWFRLRHAVEKTRAALVVVEQQINAASCSSLQLELRQERAHWKGKLFSGMALRAETRKHQRALGVNFETPTAKRALTVAFASSPSGR